MFLYNITYNIENAVAHEWIQWQKEHQIKAIINTGCFYAHRFYELLEQDDAESRAFAIQFLAKTRYNYNQYMLNHLEKFQGEAVEKWRNKYVVFSTLMKEIES